MLFTEIEIISVSKGLSQPQSWTATPDTLSEVRPGGWVRHQSPLRLGALQAPENSSFTSLLPRKGQSSGLWRVPAFIPSHQFPGGGSLEATPSFPTRYTLREFLLFSGSQSLPRVQHDCLDPPSERRNQSVPWAYDSGKEGWVERRQGQRPGGIILEGTTNSNECQTGRR